MLSVHYQHNFPQLQCRLCNSLYIVSILFQAGQSHIEQVLHICHNLFIDDPTQYGVANDYLRTTEVRKGGSAINACLVTVGRKQLRTYIFFGTAK